MVINTNDPLDSQWRQSNRIKTVSGALCLCLHIGIPPPDQIRPSPCARLECWLDPFGVPAPFITNEANTVNPPEKEQESHITLVTNPTKTREIIARSLQSQYEYWHPRAKYRLLLDTTMDELKKTLVAIRKVSKKERVIFHYNGHGVPLPTNGGEFWVFNKNYTQYIPVHVSDIEGWMGRPALIVFDCSCAGRLVQGFMNLNKGEEEFQGELIIFGACGVDETLPTTPDLPADLLTACLTTPIEMALCWHTILNKTTISEHQSTRHFPRIPGKLADRKSTLGHLNWIFTAITDCIAWQLLDLNTFKTLLRQDLLLASLTRNFLLALRIGRSCSIEPQMAAYLECNYRQQSIGGIGEQLFIMNSIVLRRAHLHPLWICWDHAIESAIQSIPITFFTDQMQSFQTWMEIQELSDCQSLSIDKEESEKDVQSQSERYSKEACPFLPIILQALLSQDHRLDALSLLLIFCSQDSRNILQCLHVGLHPYISKLLQSPNEEIRPPLIAIWLRVLLIDWDTITWEEGSTNKEKESNSQSGHTQKGGILKEDLYKYCTHTILNSKDDYTTIWIDPVIIALACLSCFMDYTRSPTYKDSNNPTTRLMHNKEGLPEWLLSIGTINERSDIRKWSWILIGSSWRAPHCKYFMSQVKDYIENALKLDKCPRVRSAVACAIGTFAIGLDINDEMCELIETFIKYLEDGLVMECSKRVRREIHIALKHCHKSLPEECRSIEMHFRNMTLVNKRTFIDPFPPNNQIESSKETIYSTLYYDEIDELLQFQRREYYKFMQRPLPEFISLNQMPPESTMKPLERIPSFIAESFQEFDENEWIDYSDCEDEDSFEEMIKIRREEVLGEDLLYTDMLVIHSKDKRILKAMMIDKNRYLIHYEDSIVIYNKGMVMEHAWNIPKNKEYSKLRWKDEKLYALNASTRTMEIWSAEEQRYITGGNRIEDTVVMFDVLGREQVHYDGIMLRKGLNYYDGETVRCLQVEIEMRNARHLISTKEYIIVICEDENGKAIANILNYGLRTIKKMEMGDDIIDIVAHKRFNWMAVLSEQEIQIIKIPQAKIIARMDLRGVIGKEQSLENEGIVNYRKIEWHPTLPKLIASPNLIGTNGIVYHIRKVW